MPGVPTHAAGIVVRDGARPEFLAVTTTGHKDEWTFPKGHINEGETPEAAAIREVKEEAGVIAEVVCPIGSVSYYKNDERVLAAYFLMREVAQVDTREDRSMSWGDLETTLRLLSFDDAREMLQSVVGRNLVPR